MTDKEGIANNDSKKSEFSSLEELEIDDQIEIISPEKDTVEPLEAGSEEDLIEEAENGTSQQVVPEAVDSEDPENASTQSDSDIFKEIKLLSDSDDGESKHRPKDQAAENFSPKADGQKDGQSNPDNIDQPYFLGVDGNESQDERPKEQGPHSVNDAKADQENNQSDVKSQKDLEPAQTQKDRIDKSGDSVKLSKKSKLKTIFGNWSFNQIIIALTLILLSFATGVICKDPTLLGFKKEAEPVTFKTREPSLAVVTASKQVESAEPLSKNDTYLAKIREAGLLRDELQSKKEEIYQLKQYYRNGISDLTAQINRELQESNITAYTEALKNRRIELNLRTIQRRRFYIQRLKEPIRWIKQGREELLYLIRKAEFDLNLIDIASGIDMDRHMRHIDAAIQKYRPSADKLAILREHSHPTPLETIWDQQIKGQIKRNDPSLPYALDLEITEEICSGNYERTAELTGISAVTARCLSQKPGSDLFLNGLRALSPAAAEHLIQWRGSWMCINGIKKLSPAAAQHLFKWKGNWISLNGLTEFGPELATYLIEWEGNQLELMGLGDNQKNMDPKTLKYLALWQAMGGKLFVADDLRQELERVTM